MSCSKEPLRSIRYNQSILLSQSDKKKYVLSQLQYKIDQDFEQIQNTSPTQNLVIDDSTMLNEQKRRCGSCLQIQKKLFLVQAELGYYKNKNAKYLKIMKKRIDKQKELQQTYYQIAKELKKKSQSLNLPTSKESNMLSSNDRQKEQVNYLHFDEKKLIASRLHLIQQNIDLKIQSGKSNRFKIVNFQICKVFFSKEETVDGDEAEVQKFLQNKQQSINCQQKILMRNQSDSFYSIDNKVSQSFLQFANAQQVKQLSRNAAQSRGQSWYSVDHQLSINEISNVLMKNSVSIQENDRNIQKQLLKELSIQPSKKHSAMIEQYSFRESKEGLNNKTSQSKAKNHQQMLSFVKKIRTLFDTLNKYLNSYGQRYKIQYPLASQIQMPLQQEQPYFWDNLIKSIEALMRKSLQQIQKILKSQKRQYQKQLNDKELSIYDLTTKIADLQGQNSRYQHIIEKYQIHKTMQSIKILDLEKALSKYANQKSHLQQKGPNLINQHKIKHEQIQCEIIPKDIYQINQILMLKNRNLTNALIYIPVILSKINLQPEKSQARLSLQNNLQEQLQYMIKKAFTSLSASKIQQKVTDQNINQEKPRQGQIKVLQIENQQLKAILRSKSQQILKYSQKLTLERIQKANLDKIIQDLSKKIDTLNIQLKLHKQQATQKSQFVSPSQKDKFIEYDRRQYNNLFQQLQESKVKLKNYETELYKLKASNKKQKKIIYIDK